MRKNAHESSSSSCNPFEVIGHMLPFVKKCSVEHIERSGGGGHFGAWMWTGLMLHWQDPQLCQRTNATEQPPNKSKNVITYATVFPAVILRSQHSTNSQKKVLRIFVSPRKDRKLDKSLKELE